VFLERGVFETRERVGVLLFLACFERKAVILPDIGIRRHLSAAQIDAGIAEMKPLLERQRIAAACEAGIGALGTLLQEKLLLPAIAGNELPDAVIEERGA
jgi:putative membrane protein